MNNGWGYLMKIDIYDIQTYIWAKSFIKQQIRKNRKCYQKCVYFQKKKNPQCVGGFWEVLK